MKQCNECRRKGCDVVELFRRGKGGFTTEHMRGNCKRHIPIKPFTDKLLVLAMAKNPQGVHDALSIHGFKLIEKPEHPYFKIYLEKKGKRYSNRRKKANG